MSPSKRHCTRLGTCVRRSTSRCAQGEVARGEETRVKESEKEEEKSERKYQERAPNPGTRIATDADMARLPAVGQPKATKEAPERSDK